MSPIFSYSVSSIKAEEQQQWSIFLDPYRYILKNRNT